MSNHYTVIGGEGFIGSEIVAHLEHCGKRVLVPRRNDDSIFKDDLGILIYAAGNGDCVNEAFGVLDSNTTHLAKILEHSIFSKLVYISSTRLYMEQENSSEVDDLKICTDDNRRLFNLTKLVSEELCLRSERETIIVRPSNVYGLALKSKLFLPSIIRNAIMHKHVDMYVAPSYAKDYVSVADVAKLIHMISEDNKYNLYNIASGKNVSAADIAAIIQKNTQCTVTWHEGFKGEYFPVTDITRVQKEYNYEFSDVLFDIEKMISHFKQSLENL